MKKFKVTMKERGANGKVSTLTQYAVCESEEDVVKFYGLNEPDIEDYKIEECDF